MIIENQIALCIADNADKIYVREKVDGKWGSFALTELSAEQALKHAIRFILDRHMPVVFKDPDAALAASAAEVIRKEVESGVRCPDCKQPRTSVAKRCGKQCLVGRCFFGANCHGCQVCQ